MPHFPEVVISSPRNGARETARWGSRSVPAAGTKISLDGLDISDAVVSFRVGGEMKDGVIELELKLLCDRMTWTQPDPD